MRSHNIEPILLGNGRARYCPVQKILPITIQMLNISLFLKVGSTNTPKKVRHSRVTVDWVLGAML